MILQLAAITWPQVALGAVIGATIVGVVWAMAWASAQSYEDDGD